jgi:hypothetical protein
MRPAAHYLPTPAQGGHVRELGQVAALISLVLFHHHVLINQSLKRACCNVPKMAKHSAWGFKERSVFLTQSRAPRNIHSLAPCDDKLSRVFSLAVSPCAEWHRTHFRRFQTHLPHVSRYFRAAFRTLAAGQWRVGTCEA